MCTVLLPCPVFLGIIHCLGLFVCFLSCKPGVWLIVSAARLIPVCVLVWRLLRVIDSLVKKSTSQPGNVIIYPTHELPIALHLLTYPHRSCIILVFCSGADYRADSRADCPL